MSLVPSVALPEPERMLGSMDRTGGSPDVEVEYEDGTRIANFDEPVIAVQYERGGHPIPLEVIVYRFGLEFDDPDGHVISLRQLLFDWLEQDETKFALATADDLERIAAELRGWAQKRGV